MGGGGRLRALTGHITAAAESNGAVGSAPTSSAEAAPASLFTAPLATAPPDPLKYRSELEDPSPQHDHPGSTRWFHHSVATAGYSPPEHQTTDPEELAATFHEQGFVVLRGAMPRQWVDACAAAFHPRFSAHVENIRPYPEPPGSGGWNRGPQRQYMDLPMGLPFARVCEQPLLAAVLRRILGPDLAAERLASDTPLGVGSVYQGIHLDMSPEENIGALDADGRRLNVYARKDEGQFYMAINWPLCDVDEQCEFLLIFDHFCQSWSIFVDFKLFFDQNCSNFVVMVPSRSPLAHTTTR